MNLKLRPDCKAHIMELYPDLFEGVSTMDGAEVKLDVDLSVPPVAQPPRKIPQAMIEPLKKEIDRMLELKVIQKLDINEARDWCHNLVLVRKPNGKLRGAWTHTPLTKHSDLMCTMLIHFKDCIQFGNHLKGEQDRH